MGTKIFIPKMGANIDTVEIGKIHVKVGDEVKKGDILFEIVTEKATFNIEADSNGLILALNCRENEELRVLDEVGYIGGKGDEIPELKKGEREKTSVKITPAARKLARDSGIDVDLAFEKSGNVVKEEDVINYLKNTSKDITREKISPYKKSEIEAIMKNKDMISSFVTVSFSTKRLRSKVKVLSDKHLISISLGEYIGYICSRVLEKHKKVNSFYDSGFINYYNKINIGFAMNVTGDLFVPIIRDANKLELAEFSGRFKELIMKALRKEYSPDDLKGGTFTITDLSSYGVSEFLPVVNSNQAAILGIGSEYDSIKIINDAIVPDKKMNLIMTFDHRLLDGKKCLDFLNEIKSYIEE